MLVTRSYRLMDVAVVELTGEVDLTTEDTMRAALAAAAESPGTGLVVCDMTNVSFLGCAGLNVLLDIRAAVQHRGASLRVVAQAPSVVLLFGITHLAEMLGLRASIEEALKD